MTNVSGIPQEIAHLDFQPDTDEQEQDVELHECMIQGCTRVATWTARLNCCKYNVHFCDTHKLRVTATGALCSRQRCGQDREARWFTNWRRVV